MPEVNLLAVLACGIASMALGGIWYSPLRFARRWQAGTGLSEEALKAGNPALIFGGAFILSLVAAYVFAMFIGPMPVGPATGAGLAAGLCWVGAAYGINYLFERRSLAMWLINGGYHIVQFTLFGLILGAWK